MVKRVRKRRKVEQEDDGVFRMTDVESKKARLIFPELLGGAPAPLDEDEGEVQEINKSYGEDFDIRTLMADAKDPLTGTLRDLKIDDRDLRISKNYWDWRYNVSGYTTYPWARQLWVALKLMGEICPRCTDKDWYSDIMVVPKDMEGEELGHRLALLEHGKCPGCGARKSELIRSGELNPYDELVLVWGQRSGKSTTGVDISGYHLHKFLKFPMFGSLTPAMSTATPLVGSFVSLNFGKAYAVLWEPFKKLISNTPWYEELFKLLDFYKLRYGEELYNRRKEFLQFAHKNIILGPKSPSWDGLRGETRFLGIIDELGLFRLPDPSDDDGIDDTDLVEDTSKRANADEAHKSLWNSLFTVRSASEDFMMNKGLDAAPTGLLLGVSSPTSLQDKVMRLLAESKTEEGSRSMLGSQLPTWEVNPTVHRDSPIVRQAFARNAQKAMRDFGAQPPSVDNTYLDKNTVREAFKTYKSTHVLEYVFGPDKDLWAVARRVRQHSSGPSLLAIDAGYTNNSFTLNTFSYTPEGRTQTDCVLEIIPSGGRKINFNKVYLNVILPIVKDNFVAYMAADQWQSLDQLHRFLEDSFYKKARSKRHSLTRANFDAVRDMLEDGTFMLPAPEMPLEEIWTAEFDNYRKYFYRNPVSHLAHQFSTIRDVGPTDCPAKAPGLTDDGARSWFLGAFLMQDPQVARTLRDARALMPKLSSVGGIGVYTSRGF